jgi:hypothetical protein
MKRMLMCAGVLLLLNATAQSQSKLNKTKVKKQNNSKDHRSNNNVRSITNASPNTVTLRSTANYPAKAGMNNFSIGETYTIGDTIVKTLDARANGADIRFNKSGIVGMPKRAYGFADGRILLRTTSAPTFGTQTGSGAVGTGTSLGTFGSNGPAMSVNGKSPYAGINMWGNAMNMNISRSDSSVRSAPVKKQ